MQIIQIRTTHIVQEGVAVKIPGVKELHGLALALRPRVAIGQWSVQDEDSHREDNEQGRDAASDHWVLPHPKRGDSVEAEVIDLAQSHNSEV